MPLLETPPEGVHVLRIRSFFDARGEFKPFVLPGSSPFGTVQLNEVDNTNANTLRGIHVEPWAKVVKVTRGKAFAAIVDLRPESPTFRMPYRTTLDHHAMLYVPKGFGNSYLTLEPNTQFVYIVDGLWDPAATYGGIRWNDPELGIEWPLVEKQPPILSEKDAKLPSLQEFLRA